MTSTRLADQARAHRLRIALLTYSTKPRGGVVHTLSLAEALHGLGHDVHVFALGRDGHDFFRPLALPSTLVPVSVADDAPLDHRIEAYIEAYHTFLAGRPGPTFDVYHAQDCISANALWRLREEGRIASFVRTVHHIDDFTSPFLARCQDNSIRRPDRIFVVSRWWQEEVRARYDRDSTVLYNGVDLRRFRPTDPRGRRAARQRLGLTDEVTLLHIGGIEPRKNTIRLLAAYRLGRDALARSGRRAVLLLAGGETLLDHAPYRRDFFAALTDSGLSAEDVRLLGTVADEHVPALYHAADLLVFPSLKEGWGLVALEAMASGVPVIASASPVFREYLESGVNALLIDPRDVDAIASAMVRLAEDQALCERLITAALRTVRDYGWSATARAHVGCYGLAALEPRRGPDNLP